VTAEHPDPTTYEVVVWVHPKPLPSMTGTDVRVSYRPGDRKVFVSLAASAPPELLDVFCDDVADTIRNTVHKMIDDAWQAG
jgi:hypothetical protein